MVGVGWGCLGAMPALHALVASAYLRSAGLMEVT